MMARTKREQIEVNQVWREWDTNCDRFVRIMEVTTLDVRVRACLLNGVLCAHTPVFRMNMQDLQRRYDLVAALSIFQIDEAAQDDPTVPRLATPEPLTSKSKKVKK